MCLIFWWKDDCKTRPLFLALLLLFTFFTIFSFLLCVLISWCPFVCRPFAAWWSPFVWLLFHGLFVLIFVTFELFDVALSVCVYAPKKKKSLGRTYHWPFFAFTCMHAHCGTSPGEICFVCLPPLCLQSRCFHGAPSSLQALLPDPLYLICGL